MIKFQCVWREGPPPPEEAVAALCRCRDALHARGLIGHDIVHDVGYGNVSVRDADGAVFVTGTQTGAVEQLEPRHVVRVLAYDLAGNRVACEGTLRASSETLSHVALYDAARAVGAVVHVHAREAWERLQGTVPTTGADVAYGTPAMAEALGELARGAPDGGVVVMGGHADGIIAYGPDLDDARERLLRALDRGTV